MKSKGYKVTVKNLYKEKFNPVLTQQERASYYDGPFDESQLQTEISQLKEATLPTRESYIILLGRGGGWIAVNCTPWDLSSILEKNALISLK